MPIPPSTSSTFKFGPDRKRWPPAFTPTWVQALIGAPSGGLGPTTGSTRMLKKSLFLPDRPWARRDAPFSHAAFSHRSDPQRAKLDSRRSNRRRGFPVRQDSLEGRTAHTKCGLYLLGPSRAATLRGTRRVPGRRVCLGRLGLRVKYPPGLGGEKSGFLSILHSSPVLQDVGTIELLFCLV